MRVSNTQDQQNNKQAQGLTPDKRTKSGAPATSADAPSLSEEFSAVLETIAATLKPKESLDIFSVVPVTPKAQVEEAPKRNFESKPSAELADQADKPRVENKKPKEESENADQPKEQNDTDIEQQSKSERINSGQEKSELAAKVIKAKSNDTNVNQNEKKVEGAKQDIGAPETVTHDTAAPDAGLASKPLEFQLNGSTQTPTPERAVKNAKPSAQVKAATTPNTKIDTAETARPQAQPTLPVEFAQVMSKDAALMTKGMTLHPEITMPQMPVSTPAFMPQLSALKLLDKDSLVNALVLRQAANLVQLRMHETTQTPITPQGTGITMAGLRASDASQAKSPRDLEKVVQVRSYQNQVLEKVDSALKEALRARDGKTISVRLDPPELGTVKVDVSMRDGNLHARLVAESQSVSTFMRERSHELLTALRKLGIHVDKITVAVHSADDSSASNQAFVSSDQEFRQHDRRSNDTERTPRAEVILKQEEQRTAFVRKTNNVDHWVA